MHEHITQFLTNIELNGSSDKTIRGYRQQLFVIDKITGGKHPSKYNREIINQIKTELAKTGRGKKTVNLYLVALRSLFRFLIRNYQIKTMQPEEIELAKEEQRKIEMVTLKEARKIFKHIEKQEDNIEKRRDYALLTTLFSTGMRIAEIASLPRNLELTEQGGYTIRGKGGKIRLVFFSKFAQEAIKSYLDYRIDSDTRLFPMHMRELQRVITRRSRQVGIEGCSAHSFRHLYATTLMSKGVPLHVVSSMLGHSSVVTTSRYLHCNNSEMASAHKKIHLI